MGKYNELFYIESDLEQQLLEGETIIWRNKPFKPAFLLNNNRYIRLAIVLFFMAIFMLALFFSYETLRSGSVIHYVTFFLFIIVQIVMMLFLIFGPLGFISKTWNYTEYALTDKRLIICAQGNGYVYNIIPLEEVKMITLRQEGFDKIFGVGDVLVTVNSGKNQGVCQILDIKDWEELYALLDDKMEELKVKDDNAEQAPEMLDGLKSIL